MVALLSSIISSFRCIITSIIPSLTISRDYTNGSVHSSAVHHWNIPLPHILHRELTPEFVNQFEEVLIIGDVHGCYDELIQLLTQINNNNNNNNNNNSYDNNNSDYNSNETNSDVNNKRILKLFVGDVVNKGPKSREVIEFLMDNSESCLSVRGNHDEVVIREYLRFEREGEHALNEPNKWIKELTRTQIDFLISMSYTIRIPSLNLMIVHAGLIPGVPLQSQGFEDMVNMRNLVMNSNNVLRATSNDAEGEPWAPKWSGPQHIYFGHDAKRKLQMNPFSTGLDTGCVYGNYLTSIFVSGLRKGTFFKVKANKIHSQPKIPIV